jgi:hypothetical protein
VIGHVPVVEREIEKREANHEFERVGRASHCRKPIRPKKPSQCCHCGGRNDKYAVAIARAETQKFTSSRRASSPRRPVVAQSARLQQRQEGRAQDKSSRQRALAHHAFVISSQLVSFHQSQAARLLHFACSRRGWHA